MPPDLALERRELIASRLLEGQSVVAAALAVEFEVSEDAVRRDLRALAADGRCKRVYGGALPVTPAPPSMQVRVNQDRDRKLRLGKVGAATIEPGELVFLDCGSTNLTVTEFLPRDHDLTVATNSVDIAAAVLRRDDLKLIVVGGMADAVIGGCVDATAVQSVAHMRIDRAFIGTCSVSAADGLAAFHYTDATFKKALVAASRRRVALVTRDKLSTTTPFLFAALDQVDSLILEHDVGDADVVACRRAGCGDVRLAAPT